MDVERWQQVREVFEAAIDLPADARDGLLGERCQGDAELRAEVERLLAADSETESAAGALDRGTPVGLARLRDRLDAGNLVGRYRIVEVLGQGGMATVYLAEQQEPVRRQVALKVVRLGMDPRKVLARFELERQTLAVMSHDAIAKVFDAGTTEQGQPYFVMEYVAGLPITDYCDRHRLSVEERIRLFQEVCAGVHHAHQKGVIHRDVKPSNVLVTGPPDGARPKIIDFGIARATDESAAEMAGPGTMLTRESEVIGTPEYMSPEQADPDVADVDTRTDIYSLGVVLYELLAGELPFPAHELRGKGFAEMQRRIRDEDPPRPSTRLTGPGEAPTETASRRRTTPAALRRALSTDLDWVVLKTLEKDRNRRYDSAAALAQDLGRYLRHEPLQAGPPSAGYRLRKLVRRYRVQVIAGALVLVTLLAGAVTSTLFAIEARANAERIGVQRTQLQQRKDEFDQLAHVVHLRAAREEEAELQPAWPEQAAAMRKWLDEEAKPLVEALPRLRQTVARLEARARPVDAGADPGGDPGSGAKAPAWAFATKSEQFLHDTLAALIGEIEAFAHDVVPDVERRLAWSGRVVQLTEKSFADQWAEARAAIERADGESASTLYRQVPPLRLAPQTGLVPIGMNPSTGLWEFYHLRSAWDEAGGGDPAALEVPTAADYDGDGRLPMTGERGLVFVLVPGGKFWIGAQRDDENGRQFDPDSREDESPPHEVTLLPYFLSKYEMTQGQWLRLGDGENPSSYRPPAQLMGDDAPVTLAHPVEQVTWTMCDRVLRSHGLELPTEAQWERACRAGTTTRWSTGDSEESLRGHANLLDQRAKEFSPWTGKFVDWDDGFLIHAPVGSFLPNGFGLFDVHGNVWEWCRDWHGPYSLPVAPGDGYREVADSPRRVSRGGSYSLPARFQRSADRDAYPPSFQVSAMGVRPARAVQSRAGG